MKTFLIFGAFVVTSIVLWCLFSSCSPKKDGLPLINSNIDELVGKGSIFVTNMTKEELLRAMDDFMKIYTQDGQLYTRPAIEEKAQGFLLTFDDNIDYFAFCFWVNYLVYSDKSVRHNDHVTGWLQLNEIKEEQFRDFAHQTLMLYIPSSDSEYDNVYFTTSNGNCFKQEFSNSQLLIEQKSVLKQYRTIPQ